MNTIDANTVTGTDRQIDGAVAAVALRGVHHTARPTWKLARTIEFYRDTLGLRLVHAISARGWGRAGHPDFLHFFFESGQGSTIAFFYYIGTQRPEWLSPRIDDWMYRSTHTAWRVDTREELDAWKAALEAKGVKVSMIQHELVDSLYFTDPNEYPVEITHQRRAFSRLDTLDASLTLQAAAELESTEGGITDIDAVWRRKAELVKKLPKL